MVERVPRGPEKKTRKEGIRKLNFPFGVVLSVQVKKEGGTGSA